MLQATSAPTSLREPRQGLGAQHGPLRQRCATARVVSPAFTYYYKLYTMSSIGRGFAYKRKGVGPIVTSQQSAQHTEDPCDQRKWPTFLDTGTIQPSCNGRKLSYQTIILSRGSHADSQTTPLKESIHIHEIATMSSVPQIHGRMSAFGQTPS